MIQISYPHLGHISHLKNGHVSKYRAALARSRARRRCRAGAASRFGDMSPVLDMDWPLYTSDAAAE
ncbi:hypothetical protein DIS09_30830 [Burkholderia pseudomallei]|nr:hypothetical protein DIS09_30830 [Burkholderia pseudomallei]